ncbi:hypothetical protein [uncultured Tateyamaria sp.]|uniref:hypothetical protein n=1 Tax=uncultured Tateyamaria sp. TaxID=455651 RepID=UPI0026364E29|nr:hypothetical protein [uncultured Tateyamaria sp.]
MQFEFTATIDSSYLTTFNDVLAPVGSTLYGTFSYDQDVGTQSGASHYFDAGAFELSVYTDEGFELSLFNRVTNVAPTDSGDSFTVQSYISEAPNDWHIVVDLFAQDFLNGSNDLPTSFPDAYDFAYVQVYFTDEFEWVQSIEATIETIVPVAEPANYIGETGTVSLNHLETTVTLQQSYETPVAMAFVATENGAQAVNVRISEVSDDAFTLQLQETGDLDGWHLFETVNYVIVEAGTWVLPDGTVVQAGTFQSDQLSTQGFDAVAFDTEFDDTPLVFSQVQTFNGQDFVTTRQTGTNTTGVQITMQEEEARNDGGHVQETIGWIAMEAGSGTAGDVTWAAGQTSGIDHTTTSVDLGASFDADANVIAMLSSFVGGDPAWARGSDSSQTAFDVSVEEDVSSDPETWHFEETVDYFVFEDAGLLGGSAYDLLG